jgi:hypothetical protein
MLLPTWRAPWMNDRAEIEGRADERLRMTGEMAISERADGE